MRVRPVVLSLVLLAGMSSAEATTRRVPPPPPPPVAAPPPPTVPVETGLAAFRDVVSVLQSPRCQNCHPAGEAPLQTDQSLPHSMGITRDSPRVGVDCATCHRPVGLGLPNTPPANPHWHMPPASQVFEGRTAAALCAQLKDPASTGGRDLAALRAHVAEDPLVLYGWEPGGERTTPPLSHADFVRRFGEWVDAGAPCPTP
jgi:hypothetical protein